MRQTVLLFVRVLSHHMAPLKKQKKLNPVVNPRAPSIFNVHSPIISSSIRTRMPGVHVHAIEVLNVIQIIHLLTRLNF